MSRILPWRALLNASLLPASITSEDPDTEAAKVHIQKVEVLGGMLDRVETPDLFPTVNTAIRAWKTSRTTWRGRLLAMHTLADRAARAAEGAQRIVQSGSADATMATVTVDPRVGPVHYALCPSDDAAVPLYLTGVTPDLTLDAPITEAVSDGGAPVGHPTGASLPLVSAAAGGAAVLLVIARDIGATGNEVQVSITEGPAGTGQPAVIVGTGATFAAVAGDILVLSVVVAGVTTLVTVTFDGFEATPADFLAKINLHGGGLVRGYFAARTSLAVITLASGGTVAVSVGSATTSDVRASLGFAGVLGAQGTGTYDLVVRRGEADAAGHGRVETYTALDPYSPLAAYQNALNMAVRGSMLLGGLILLGTPARPDNLIMTSLAGGTGAGRDRLTERLARAAGLSVVLADPNAVALIARYAALYAAAWASQPALTLPDSLDKPVGSPALAVGLALPSYTILTAIAELATLLDQARVWGAARAWRY